MMPYVSWVTCEPLTGGLEWEVPLELFKKCVENVQAKQHKTPNACWNVVSKIYVKIYLPV